MIYEEIIVLPFFSKVKYTDLRSYIALFYTYIRKNSRISLYYDSLIFLLLAYRISSSTIPCQEILQKQLLIQLKIYMQEIRTNNSCFHLQKNLEEKLIKGGNSAFFFHKRNSHFIFIHLRSTLIQYIEIQQNTKEIFYKVISKIWIFQAHC